MCGFVGFKNTPEVASPQNVIKAMADRIIHRGPDDADYYVDDQVSLGFRRLSIIDLEGGRQPILNEDGTKVLVFNGEIYNFQSLREDLLEKGHVFKTRTDSETILHVPHLTLKSRVFPSQIPHLSKNHVFSLRYSPI